MNLNQTIYQRLSELSAYTVIRADQNGKEPEKPFMTYDVKWDKTPEHFHYGKLDDEGKQKVSSHVESVLELQVFGKGAVDRLRAVLLKLATYSERLKWINAGVVIVDEGRLSNMPFLNEAQAYEERAIVEVTIRHSVEIMDDVGYFNRVEVTDTGTSNINTIEVKNGEN